MKGGSKFKLKTGTIGKLPPKRPSLPAELFNMKELPPGGEEEDEEEEEAGINKDRDECSIAESKADEEEFSASVSEEKTPLKEKSSEVKEKIHKPKRSDEAEQRGCVSSRKSVTPPGPDLQAGGDAEPAAEPSPKKKKRVMGPSRPPVQLTGQYPQDDPEYSVWMPPAGQTGDGRTHLNDRYGY